MSTDKILESNNDLFNIGIAKEAESPENPGSLEKRVALIPSDVKKIKANGVKIFIEEGAGEGIGFSDFEYEKAGAILESHDKIYQNKNMVIKFKGPPINKVKEMRPGTILFCMAHFNSFPERAALLKKGNINVIAMEEILDSPKNISDDIIKSKCFVNESLNKQHEKLENLHISFLGYGESLIGGIRRAGNRSPESLNIYQKDVDINELSNFGKNSLYFYDSYFYQNKRLLGLLKEKGCQTFNLQAYLNEKPSCVVNEYRKTHPPFQFGGRRIQCLHETGMAGARYGFNLLKEKSFKKIIHGKNVKASVLGYGNVGMGAIDECYHQGVRKIQILGKRHTQEGVIESYLESSHLIVNGAEQPIKLRGKNFLIKKKYVGEVISAGSVVIDLVGGSASNRSPVEDIIECTYLTNPHFERNGVLFSALWGWPMMGMMKESAIRYSVQICQILNEQKHFRSGVHNLPPGIKRALVCGPFID